MMINMISLCQHIVFERHSKSLNSRLEELRIKLTIFVHKNDKIPSKCSDPFSIILCFLVRNASVNKILNLLYYSISAI